MTYRIFNFPLRVLGVVVGLGVSGVGWAAPPVAVQDAGTTDANTVLTVGAPGLLTNDSDPDGDTFTVTAVGTTLINTSASNIGTALTSAFGGDFTIMADGSYTFDPDGDFASLSGSSTKDAVVYYDITDTNGEVSATPVAVRITVTAPAPTAVDDSGSTNADTILTVNAANGLLANDNDPPGAGTLMITEVGGTATTRAAANIGVPIRGQAGGEFIINADGSYTFNPNGDFSTLGDGITGSTGAYYRVSDGTITGTARVQVSVTGTADSNQRPTPVDDTGTINSDTTLTVSAANGLLANDTDPNTGDTLVVTRVGTVASLLRASTLGTATYPTGNRGFLTIEADGSYTFNPVTGRARDDFSHLAPGETAVVSVVYEVADNHGAKSSTVGTLRITVTGATVGSPPVAVADAGATDPTTTLTVADGATGTMVGGVTINADVLLNDTDPDGDNLVVSAAAPGVGGLSGTTLGTAFTALNGGSFLVRANGSWTFDPSGAFAGLTAGANSITYAVYQASDGTNTDTATISVTVTNPTTATAPVAVDDTGATNPSTRIDIAAPGVLDNDSDPNGDTFTVTALGNNAGDLNTGFLAGLFPPIFNATSGGQFTIRTTGAWSFNPAGDFSSLAVGASATTSVVYQISDTNGETDTATITVTVTNPADTPPSFGSMTQDDLTFPSARTISPNVLLPEASGGNGNLSYTVTPDLAVAVPGLIFTPGARTLSGTPTTNAAAVTLTYTASDADMNMADSDTASLTFTVTVIDPQTGEISLSVTGSGGDRDMSAPGLQVDEGDTIVLTTTFHGKTGGTVQTRVDASGTARYQLHGVTAPAADPNDITPNSLQTSAFVNITHDALDAGETETTNFPVNNDTVSENDETLILTLSGTPSTFGATGSATWTFGTPNSVTVTIRANDDSQAYIADTAPTTVAAGGTLNVPVAIRGSARTGVSTVNFTFTGTATTADYSVTTSSGSGVSFNPATATGSITFSTTQTSRNIPVVLTADADAADETLIVTLSGHAGMVASPASTAYDTTAHTVTITPAAASNAPSFDGQTVPDQTFVPGVAGMAAQTGITNLRLPLASGPAPIAYTVTPDPFNGLGFGLVGGAPQYGGIPTAVSSGLLTYTATNNDGAVSLTFRVETVANSAPDLGAATQSDLTPTVDDPITAVTFPAASGGNGEVAYSMVNLAAVPGLNFDANTRTLSGTPTAVAGEVMLTYTAADDDNDRRGSDIATLVFGVTVVAAGPPPVPEFDTDTIPENTYVPGVAGQASSTGIHNVRLPRATVSDGSGVTYTMDPMSAGGLGLEITTGTFGGIPPGPVYSGIPTNDIGRHIFTYTATGGGGSGGTAVLTFAISIVANSVPDLPAVDNLTYVVGESVNVTLPPATGGNIGTHIRGRLRNIYTLNLGTGAGNVNIPGLTWNAATRVLSGTPSAAGGPHMLNYGVSDDDNDRRASDVDSESFTVTVTAAAPDFGAETVDDQNYIVGQAIATLTLPEASGATSYTLTPSGALNGLAFDASNRQVTGSPAAAEVNSLTYTATNATGNDTLTFSVTAAADTAPAFAGGASQGDLDLTVDEAISPVVVLPAASGGNGEVSYTLDVSGVPGLVFTPGTRTLSGTPSAVAGAVTLTYIASDADANTAAGDTATLEFEVTVGGGPDYGTVTLAASISGGDKDATTPGLQAEEGDTITLTATFHGRTTTTGLTRVLATVSGTATHVLSDDTMPSNTGEMGDLRSAAGGMVAAPHYARFVNNFGDGRESVDFVVTVIDDSRAEGDETIVYTLDSTTDFIWLPAAAGTTGPTAPLAIGTPGSVTITILESDQPEIATAAFTTALGGRVDAAYNVGATVDLTLPVATGGNAPLAYSIIPDVTMAVPGLSFDAATRVLSGMPTTEAGAAALTYRVTDNDGNTADQPFSIAVNAVGNTVPTFGSPTQADQTYTIGVRITNLTLPTATGAGGTVADADGGTVTYTLVPDVAATVPGLVFTAFSGVPLLSGTPSVVGGPHSLTLIANDGDTNMDASDTATLVFSVTVEAPVDLMPTFGSTTQGDLSFPANTAIGDVTLPAASGGDGTLVYSLTPAVPGSVAGLAFNAGSRVLSGTPTAVAGAVTLTYTATDTDDDAASLTFSVTVTAAGTAPAPVAPGDVGVSFMGLDNLNLTIGSARVNTYTVALDAPPTGSVTITPTATLDASPRVTSSDMQLRTTSSHDRVTITPASHTFTDADWNEAKTFTVTVGDDTDAASVRITHRLTSGDGTDRALTTGDETVTISESVVATEEDAVNRVILPEITRAMSDRQVGAVARRVGQARSKGGGGGSSSAAVSASAAAWAAEAMRSGADSGFDGKAMLGASDFVLPLGASGGLLGESAAMWGSGDFRQLGGESGKINWDGDLLSVNAGVDAHLQNGLLAGLMLSWNEADIGYTDDTTGVQERGDYDLDMVSIHPYIGNSTPDGRLDWWATLGYGTGDLAIRYKTNNARASSDITLQMLGVGGNSRLLASGDSELRLKAEAFTTRTDVDGGKASDLRRLSSLDVDARRVRLALQARRPQTLSSGANLTLEVEGGMRYDGGDGETGSGVEFGSALRYTDAARGLTLGLHTRALLYHAGDYEDFGIGGDLRLNAGADGQGLSLSLTPAYGNTAGGAEEVWRGGLSAVAADADLQASLNTRVGYGLPSATFMLTPYGEMAFGEEVQNYRLGLSWGVGRLFDLNLVGERAEKDGVGSDHAVWFEGRVRF